MKQKNKNENSTRELLSNAFFVLLFLFKTNKKLFFVRALLLTVQISATFIPIIFVRLILNALTDSENIKNIVFYILFMAVATFASDLLNSLISYCDLNEVTKTRYLANLSLGRSIMKFPYSEIEKPKVKNFVTLAQGDSLIYIFNVVMSTVSSVVTVLGLAAIVLTIQPFILILIAAVIACKMLIDKKRRNVSIRRRNEQAQYGRESAYLYEIMREIPYAKEVRVNNISKWLYNKIGIHTEEKMIPIVRKNNRDYGMLDLMSFLTRQFQDVAVYLILAYKVIFFGMSIGDFSMYLTSINSFANSVGSVFSNFSELIQQGLFAKEFRYCMEKSSDVIKDEPDVKVEISGAVKIEFRHVYFKYPDTEKMILKDISFVLNPGETLSIVGENGAGKTTLVKLLCRFYIPTEGEILVNDVPIQNFTEDEYYNIIGAVFQDFKLFSFSVAENVGFSTKYDQKRMNDSIHRSGLDEKISKLPKSINTYISKEFDDKGVEFSGGEGQKLAIARALYKNTPAIILDEPTSALDPIAEYDIYRHFDDLTRGKSTIYISHRLSSTRFTDKIIVLSNGYLAEIGNHIELIKKENGVYKEMFDMQAQYYI